ncbi:hypothetical protein [Streptomyces sp. NBRC 109706]|uniref:hypothetical protein n=1 Tax=Streptomyces sp. NBRC 109706 TaxID=1550035 RepID=UPI00082A40A4|nr:hypothetical protein [Streptomyces sp. NBRC 109706]
MGWTVLYIAFGFVALWLLGEVLLQYKARLRWRLVAFFGFLGVVVGVLIPSVPVIALGAVAFATGQTFVTLSFRRGFSTGWALGGKPGTSRRRRAPREDEQPVGDEPAAEHGAPPFPPPPPPAPAEAPDGAEPAHAGAEFGGSEYGGSEYGSSEYGGSEVGGEIYGGQPYAQSYQESYQEPAAETGYGEPYPGAYQENYAAATGYADQGQYPAGGTDGYGYQTGWDGSNEYAAQADQLGQPTGFGGTETPGYPGESGTGGQWPQGTPTYQETPPGGVWVPQQREPAPEDADGYGWAQQPEGYPQQTGYDSSGQGYYYNNDGRY